MSAERAHPKPLSDDEIDEIVIAEANDPDAWDDPIHVIPKRDRLTPAPKPDAPPKSE